MPTLALDNGLWVGKIPDELRDLTYAEQLFIARVCHNKCTVKVSPGMSKMHANPISFSNSMLKIYNFLPLAIEQIDEDLALIYTGPWKPTKADLQWMPLLVRHLKVSKALHWNLIMMTIMTVKFQTKFGFIFRGMSSSGFGLSSIEFKQKSTVNKCKWYRGREWHNGSPLPIHKVIFSSLHDMWRFRVFETRMLWTWTIRLN